MSLIILKKILLPKTPLNIVKISNKLYISTKSNKIFATDTDLSSKKPITFESTIDRIIDDGDVLNCISKNKLIYKYNTTNNKHHKMNIKYDISYIRKIEESNKFLVGLKDGKVFYSTTDFKPLRMFYGCTNRILDVCDSFKDKMVVTDKNLVVIDIKTSKVKIHNIGFVTCLFSFNKKILVAGSDNGIFLYDIEKDKIFKTLNFDTPVSCLKVVNDKILVGCENGILYTCKMVNNDIKLIDEVDLQGIVNFIEIFNNKAFIGVGREEKDGSFGRNRGYRSALYKCTIN